MLQKKTKLPLFVRKPFLVVYFAFVLSCLSALAILTISHSADATTPTLNFQARLLTSSGAIVSDGNYNVEFKIYSGASCDPTTGSGCSTDWTENYYGGSTDNRLRVADGYLSANLGSITPFNNSIPWGQPLWLSMNIGGTTNTSSPTLDGAMFPYLTMTSVPAAMSLDYTDGTHTGTLAFTSTLSGNDTIALPDASGTVCLSTSSGGNCSAAGTGYILNQSSTPGSAQTGSFNITGTGVAGALQSGALDTASAGTLAIGTNTATGITLGNTSETSATTISGGSSGIAIQGGANDAIAIGNQSGTTANSLTIGNASANDVITLQTASTAAITSSNFNLSTAGVVKLAGGQTTDITTPSVSTANGLTINPGASATNSGTGANLVLKGGAESGTGSTGGGVSIDAGAGSSNGGSVNIGAANAKAIQIGAPTGAAATQTIGIGNDNTAGTNNTVTIGSSIGSSTTTIQAGSGGINLSQNTAINSKELEVSDASDLQAFYVTNGSSNLFTVDTTDSRVIVGSTSLCSTSKLCVAQNLNSGGGTTSTTNNNVSTIQTGEANNTTLVSQNFTLNDTSISNTGDALEGIVLNTSGTTNASTSITSIQANTVAASSGYLLQLEGGGTNEFTVSNSGGTFIQPSTNVKSLAVDQNTSGSFGQDIFDIQGSSGSNNNFIQVTSTGANAGAVNISSLGAGNAVTINSAAASGGSTGSVAIATGAQTGSSLQSGNLSFTTGNAAGGTNSSSGSITIDSGTKSGSGTTGAINIGTNNSIAIGIGNPGSTTTVGGVLQAGASTGSGSFINNGTTTYGVDSSQSFSANGSIANINSYSALVVTATNSGLTLTLPDPSSTTAGKTLYINNNSSGSNLFTLSPTHGVSAPLNTGATATLLWNGSAWTYAGTDTSSILNQSATAQAGSFNITGTGTVGTSLQAPIIDTASAATLYLGTNGSGTGSASGITIGSTTETGTITLGQSTGTNTINIGSAVSSSHTQTIGIGTSAAGTTNVTIGAASGATAGTTTLQSVGTLTLGNALSPTINVQSAASGSINIGNNAVANTIQIGSITGAVAQTIAIGNNATTGSTGTITIGNLLGSSTTTIQAGSGGINLSQNTVVNSKELEVLDSSDAQAFYVSNGTTNLLTVNTTNSRVSIGNPALCSTSKLCVAQNLNSGGGTTSTTNNNVSTIQTGEANNTTLVSQNFTLNDTSISNTGDALEGIVLNTSGTTNASTSITSIQANTVAASSGYLLQLEGGGTNEFTVSNTGATLIQPSTNTASALVVNNNSSVAVLTADTNANKVVVGSGTANATNTLLVLNNYNGTEGTEVNGAMYYNSSIKTFRCGQNGTWVDCTAFRYIMTDQGNQSGNAPPSGDSDANSATAVTFSDTYSVPANDCVAGRSYVVNAGGIYTDPSGDTTGQWTARILWGSTTVGTTSSSGTPLPTGRSHGAVTNAPWNLYANLTCYTNFSGTTSMEVSGMTFLDDSAANFDPTSGGITNGSIGQTLTTTSSQNLGIQWLWNTTISGQTVTLRNMSVQAYGP